MNNALAAAQNISSHLGKTISDLCKTTLGNDDSSNHCAHFIDHVLRLKISRIHHCKNFSLADRKVDGDAAAIRVDEIFNQIIDRGSFSSVSKMAGPYLIFVTLEKNINRKGLGLTMGNLRYKHVGVFYANSVYHYSNLQDKFVRDEINEFKAKFSRSYGRGEEKVSFYYGAIQ